MQGNNKSWKPNDEEAFKKAYYRGCTNEELGGMFGGTRDKAEKYVARLKAEGGLIPRGQFSPGGMTDDILEAHGLNPVDFEARTIWAKTKEASVKLQRVPIDWNAMFDSLASRAPKYPVLERPKKKTGRMLEPALYDLHLGKHAWAEESGENYDVKIAVERYRNALYDLLGRFSGERFDEVVLVWGQDLSHVDNKAGTTTNGTQLDFDSRFEHIVRNAAEVGIETIEAARILGPVKVKSVPGNHGRHVDIMLCMMLEAYFNGCEDVEFDTTAKSRKYHQFGKVGLGFAHGDGFRPDKLPMLFAAEEPGIWGSTKWREFHHGHLHHNSVKEHPGCTLRQLPSLSSTDAWHYNGGWTGMKKEAQVLVWHKEDGLEAVYSHFA